MEQIESVRIYIDVLDGPIRAHILPWAISLLDIVIALWRTSEVAFVLIAVRRWGIWKVSLMAVFDVADRVVPVLCRRVIVN